MFGYFGRPYGRETARDMLVSSQPLTVVEPAPAPAPEPTISPAPPPAPAPEPTFTIAPDSGVSLNTVLVRRSMLEPVLSPAPAPAPAQTESPTPVLAPVVEPEPVRPSVFTSQRLYPVPAPPAPAPVYVEPSPAPTRVTRQQPVYVAPTGNPYPATPTEIAVATSAESAAPQARSGAWWLWLLGGIVTYKVFSRK